MIWRETKKLLRVRGRFELRVTDGAGEFELPRVEGKITKINHKGLQKTANEYAEENYSKWMNKEIQGKPTSVRISSRVRGIWSQAYWGPFDDFSWGEGAGSVHRLCCLLPRPHYSARIMRFESRGPSVCLKCIDREGLERRPTSQRLMHG